MNKKYLNRAISLLLILVLLITNLVGCGQTAEKVEPVNPTPQVDTEKLVEAVVDSIQEDIAEGDNLIEEKPSIEEIEEINIGISDNWEEYVGDVETFVYGLLLNQLSYYYDVFPACAELSDGSEIYGLAYTNYEECYTNEDESQAYFMAGMIPYYGERAIPLQEFDDGILIRNMDYEDDKTSFILEYGSDEFYDHCVVYGQYVKYGVDSKGVIFIEASDYEKGSCDETLGSLYSFDEEKCVYTTDVGNALPLSGKSLSDSIDYAELEKEINRVLDEQDFNFASVDVESYAYASQEAIVAYFLSLQEETFLGYPVDELVRMAEELDPLECLQINADGLCIINLDEAPKEGEDALVKWLVGAGCVLLTAVGVVGSIVFIECPPLSAACGAISGVAIEIFMEVIIENEKLDEINWGKVAIAAATGAISGFMGPYIMATYGGATYFVLDSALDGLLGGIEQAVLSWMDGEAGIEVLKNFGTGLALGFALSAGFKGIAAGIGKVVNKVSSAISSKAAAKTAKDAVKKVSKAQETGFSKLTKKLSKLAEKTGSKVTKLKKAVNSTVFHSEYVSKKLAERLQIENADKLLRASLNSLKKDDILDDEGNVITKKALKELFENADDNTVIAHYRIGDEIVDIKKANSVIGVVFDKAKYQTVTLPDGIIADRQANFEAAAKELLDSWIDDSSKIPSSIAKKIEESGIDIEDMSAKKLVDIIQSSDMVLHENVDLKTITLVARSLHDKANETGIAHFGGYALAKKLKTYMAEKEFSRFISAAATNAVIASEY